MMRSIGLRIGFIFACASLTACSSKTHTFDGYVEGDFVYVSPYVSGQIMQLNVARGDTVTLGQTLFSLQATTELAQLQAAQAAKANAEANLQNLQKGDRPSELAEIQGQVKQAQAQVIYTQKQEQRYKALIADGSISQSTLDQAIQDADNAQGMLKQYQSALKTAQLAARKDVIHAAQMTVNQTTAQLAQAEWTYKQAIVTAPVSGQVMDIYHWVGEQAVAMQPVLVLLPPDKIKTVFFVPEPYLKQIHLGEAVSVSCDGCDSSASAVIRFISPTAEYTPPVIYSRSSESKLVYRVEAYFDSNPTDWHPGQPITITVSDQGADE